MSATVGTRTELLEELVARYPQIPPEAVLKEDLLRTGMAFDVSALTDNLDGGVKPKSYFIFSFDQKPLAELEMSFCIEVTRSVPRIAPFESSGLSL